MLLQSFVSDLINVLEVSDKNFITTASDSTDKDVIDVIEFARVGVRKFALNWTHT